MALVRGMMRRAHHCIIFIAFLLFSTTRLVASQSCNGHLSDKETGSCHHQEDNHVEPEPFTRDSDVAEELDFFPPDEIELDMLFYFGKDATSKKRRKGLSPVELIRNFIRRVKGVPEDNQETNLLVSGSNMKKKPTWCFYPYILKELVKVELNIYEMLKKYYDDDDEEGNGTLNIPLLRSYFRDIEESSLRAKFNVETSQPGQDPYLYIASHPILIYRLVRRFAEDLQPLLRILESVDEDLVMELYEFANPDLLVFPNQADLDDALELISRMQHGNTLDSYELARGILDTVDTGIHLNALHCLEIGSFYLKRRDFDYSVQWYHIALERALKSQIVKRLPEIGEFFNRTFENAVRKHNNVFKVQFGTRWDPGVFNSTVIIPFVPSSYVRRIEQLDPEASKEKHVLTWNWAIRSNFRRVCSGQNLQSEAEKALLKCWYHRKHNPYWYINPLKTELLSFDPPVFQMYDFFGEKLMKQIRNAAVQKLQRSTVVDRNSATESKVDSTRTSSQTWLYDETESGKFLVPLSEKLELMSGLVIVPKSASDEYQVAAYGPSHHYEAHIDSFEDSRRCIPKGNRITTIMGYLNDVEVGGRTGFPVLGIAADPIKGSLVMWDNLKKNGNNRDERTWHGGCPVVLGVKWITNKWVYYNDNMFTFQCTLDMNE